MRRILLSSTGLLFILAAPALSEGWELVQSDYYDSDNDATFTRTQAVVVSMDQSARMLISCEEGQIQILVEEVGKDFGYRDEPAMLTLSTNEHMQMFNYGGVNGAVYVSGMSPEISKMVSAMQNTNNSIEALAVTPSDIEIRAEFSSQGSSETLGAALRDCL